MRLRLLLLAAAALGLVAATPVPHPPELRPGAAAQPGLVAWVPAVQVATGTPGEVVGVDLALDDGTDETVQATLAVREVEVDPVAGPRTGRASSALTLAADAVTLTPGDRVVLRATGTVPERPTLVGVEATLAGTEAAPTALVLLGPPPGSSVRAAVALDGPSGRITVTNPEPFPVLVDLRVVTRTWVGRRTDATVHDLLVGADGTREVSVDAAAGPGRRRAELVVAVRGGSTTRASDVAWAASTLPALLALLLVVATGTLATLVWRRR